MEEQSVEAPPPSGGRGGVIKRIAIGSICAVLGGLSGCGVGGTFHAMAEPLGTVGASVSTLLGWITGAAISLATAAVWLRADLRVAATRLWWVYLGATLLGAYGVNSNLVGGANEGRSVAGWGWLWLPLFSGAWTSLLFCGAVAAWAALQKRGSGGGITTR